MRALLKTVRNDYPELEKHFEPYRVGLWEGSAEPATKRGGGLPWGIGIALVIAAVRLLASLSSFDGSPSTTTSPPSIEMPAAFNTLRDQDADIQLALDGVGDGSLKWADVQKRNQKLAMVLQSNWSIARNDNQGRFAFAASMRKLLYDRYQSKVIDADYASVAEYRRITLERGKALRARAARACDDFFIGRPVSLEGLPPAIGTREDALVSRVLLTSADATGSRGRGTFMLPDSVANSAARAAGLTPAQLHEALNDRGTPANRCNARIGLLETVLALPPTSGFKLLREI